MSRLGFLKLAVLIVVLVCQPALWVYGSAVRSIYAARDLPKGTYDALVVPGAAVRPDGSPSGILEDRLDGALELYSQGVAPLIIVSGNKEDNYDEPSAMKAYLVERGVQEEDVVCDTQGYTTADTMRRAHDVFGAQRIVITTQRYHLYRSIYLAQRFGMQAFGVPTDYHSYDRQLWYNIRECGACIKAVFFLNKA